MPLYEYRCTACNRLTEKRQKFSDAELTVCPFCQGKLERTISAPAVHFAGGGWYADLYSSNKGGAKKDAAAPGSTDGASGSPSAEAGASSSGTDGGSSTPATTTPAAPAPASAPSSSTEK